MTSLDYVYLATPLRPQAVLEYIFGGSVPVVHADFPAQREYYAGTFYSGYHIDARNINPLPTVTHPQDVLEFQPTVELIFTPEKETQVSVMQDWILRTTLDLIRHAKWDTGMIFEDSTKVILNYHAGQLVLNQSVEFWTAERLQRINMPYETKTFPKIARRRR